MSLKSTRHRNTGTWPEEVKEDLMVMIRAQEQRQQKQAKQKKIYWSAYYTIMRGDEKKPTK
jgi:hypothetical protein